jgi:hypothetical protein
MLGALVALGSLGPHGRALAKSAPPVRAGSSAAPLPVSVDLAAVEPTRWTVRLRNTSTARVTVPVDARLVALELTPPAHASRAKARGRRVTCELPRALRPGDDEVGSLALEPGKAVAIDFDPRLVCFSKNDAEALLAADRVSVRYSLPGLRVAKTTPTVTSEPVAVPEAARPPVRVGPLPSQTESASGSANDTPSPSASPAPPSPDASVESPPRIDGLRAATTSVHIAITHTSGRTRTLFVRPGSVGFLVEGPSGAFTCPVKGMAPIAELETRLAPRATATIDVLLGPTCAGRSFDRPGLYVVRPVFSSPKPEWDQGRSLDGERVGPPSLIRLETGRAPLLSRPPRLE